MIDKKELFLNQSIRSGGFYELCIQVCPSVDTTPIKIYSDFIWSLACVEGPYDNNFERVRIQPENMEHQGILHLDNYYIPFKTYNIREQAPIEEGFNWYDICFYTATIDKVFGLENQTWTDYPVVPQQLEAFLNKTMLDLYQIYPFLLAMIDFEISGQYYLSDFKAKLNNWSSSKFFIGRENMKLVAKMNKDIVTFIG
ncbi:hypothetical protein [Telluribacter sp. SYSU D00476]|uniref:hypothetical protein n=1 Tax=Telluribacter sp. SYSU D00476 TaxID=2811430 RepID=UPI001FF11FD4|nr:hypothetical protein [Telluribacter sp. SYSU D00476]